MTHQVGFGGFFLNFKCGIFLPYLDQNVVTYRLLFKSYFCDLKCARYTWSHQLIPINPISGPQVAATSGLYNTALNGNKRKQDLTSVYSNKKQSKYSVSHLRCMSVIYHFFLKIKTIFEKITEDSFSENLFFFSKYNLHHCILIFLFCYLLCFSCVAPRNKVLHTRQMTYYKCIIIFSFILAMSRRTVIIQKEIVS